MAYEQLKSNIRQYIRQNGQGAITGQILQDTLIGVVNALAANSQFGGIASMVETPDIEANVFYFATAGTYEQFGGLEVGANELAIFEYKSEEWVKESLLEGTDVEANPEGEATAGNLTKLKVGEEIYNVPQGGISPDMSFDQKLQAQANLNDTDADAQTGKMGYKVLQPQTEDPTTSFAAQIAGLTNTIFEIRDVYDLGGLEVTIPEGCILKFNGGAIKNGIVVGDDTFIDANYEKIFDLTTTLSGSFKNAEIYAEWFGAKADGETDNIPMLQKTFDVAIAINKPLQLLEGTYIINTFDTESHRLYITFTEDGQNLVVRGAGKYLTSIKCADGWLDRQIAATNWTEKTKVQDGQTILVSLSKTIWNYSIYYYRNSANSDANSIEFSDLTFDKNGSSNITSEFKGTIEYEYGGVTAEYPYSIRTETTPFFTSALNDSTCDFYRFKNIYLKGLTAGGIGVGNAIAKSILFENISSDGYDLGATATKREEIYPLAICDDIVIDNCSITYSQIEPVQSQAIEAGKYGGRNFRIVNSKIDKLEFNDAVLVEVEEGEEYDVSVDIKEGGEVVDTKYYCYDKSMANLSVVGCDIQYFNFSHNIVKIADSNINIQQKSTIQSSDCSFVNCNITIASDKVLQFYNRSAINNVIFDSCRIILKKSDGGTTNQLIIGYNKDAVTTNITFSNCYIETHDAWISNYGQGLNILFDKCIFANEISAAIRVGGYKTYIGFVRINNCKTLTKNLQLVDLVSNNNLYRLSVTGSFNYPILIRETKNLTTALPSQDVLDIDCNINTNEDDLEAIDVDTIMPPNMRLYVGDYVYEAPTLRRVNSIVLSDYIKYFEPNKRFALDLSELSDDITLDYNAPTIKGGEPFFARIEQASGSDVDINNIIVLMDDEDITPIAHTKDSTFIYIPAVVGNVKIMGEMTPRYMALKCIDANGGTITVSIEGTTPSSGWTTPTFEYSTDGETWNNVTLGTAISVNQNDIVYFRGENPFSKRLGGGNFNTHFALTGDFEGSGDVTSLINNIGGWLKDEEVYVYIFSRLFAGTSSSSYNPLVKAPNIPIHVAPQCVLLGMFAFTNIDKSPVLYPINLGSSSYNTLFDRCSNLNEIKTFMEDLGTNDTGAANWARNVNANGNFYCKKGLVITRGNSGIPTYWTRRNIDEDGLLWVGLSFENATVYVDYTSIDTDNPYPIQEIIIADNYVESVETPGIGVIYDKEKIEDGITYISDNEDVAVVDNGAIKIIGNGEANIIASYPGDRGGDGYGSAEASYKIVVSGVPQPEPEPEPEDNEE